MGTSNWQQIPFCIDGLMKIGPQSVLDVGVGFGRWGMIVREFCDVWYQRIFKEDWAVRVEGIEAFPKSIDDYHRAFYNKIHIGDAAELIPTLPGPWGVTIYGDVLEHFTKEQANTLLSTSLANSDYVIVNIPIGEEHPQGELYGNSFERHLSSWQVADFRPFGLVRHVLLKDYIQRDYGSFILSRKDPKDLKTSLFTEGSGPAGRGESGPGPELFQVLERVAEQSFELGFIKRSASYRLAGKLRKAPLGRVARRLKSGSSNTLRIRPLARPGSTTAEVWVFSIHASVDEPGIPWDFVEYTPEFTPKPSDGSAYGQCLCGQGGELSVRTGPDPKVRLLTHEWSTLAEVEFNGRREVIDLGAYKDGSIEIYPARTPMVEARAQLRSAPAENGVTQALAQTDGLTQDELATVARLRARAHGAVAVYCPRWLGITSSTLTLFDGPAACYPVPPTAGEEPHGIPDSKLARDAKILTSAGIKHLIVSGGDLTHMRLLDMMRAIDPEVVCDVLWHGSYVQVSEDYAWSVLLRWVDAVRDGRVRSILTVKAGMEEFFRANGIPSALLHNFVPGEPLSPPVIEDGRTHVGLWLSSTSYRKVPHAMLAALSMVKHVTLHAAGLDQRARDFVSFLRIPAAEIQPNALPQQQLPQAIRNTHVSLYVTFSECCPMLPLESLQQGVPCLIGPVSHLFEDNEFLFDRLVVPSPDRADVIAAYIERAVAERDEIIAEWARYAPRYNARAMERVKKLLADGPVPITGSTTPELVGAAAPLA